VRLAVVATALAVVLAGCDGGGEEDAGRIDVSGGSAKDEQIGADLRAYVERGCGRVSSLDEWRAMIARAEEPPPRVLRGYFVRRYGGVDRAFESFRITCRSYRAIVVEGGVITVETALRGYLARVRAGDVCNTIQGSDVADFTRGHRVLGEDGSELAECPARSG
jgi:hypothetical protein